MRAIQKAMKVADNSSVLRLVCVILVLASLARVLDAQAAAEDAEKRPRLARSLNAGETDSWYYKVSIGDRPFGYFAFELRAEKDEKGETVYAFEGSASGQMPDGAQVIGEGQGILSREFRPQRMKMTRIVKAPDGSVLQTVEASVEVAADSILLNTVSNGTREANTVPLPNVELIWAVDVYIEFSDPKTVGAATLYELDAETGETIELHAKLTEKDGIGSEVRLTKVDGQVAYVLDFDSQGKLERWSEGAGVGVPSAVRISKDEYDKSTQKPQP